MAFIVTQVCLYIYNFPEQEHSIVTFQLTRWIRRTTRVLRSVNRYTRITKACSEISNTDTDKLAYIRIAYKTFDDHYNHTNY
jgi:hypothetical protein